jgi:hypothetical protein
MNKRFLQISRNDNVSMNMDWINRARLPGAHLSRWSILAMTMKRDMQGHAVGLLLLLA